MKTKWIQTMKWGVFFLLSFAILPNLVLTGCAIQTTVGINPYVLVSGVNSTDPTPLFLGIYGAFLSEGFATGLTAEETQALLDAQQSGTTNLSGLNFKSSEE